MQKINKEIKICLWFSQKKEKLDGFCTAELNGNLIKWNREVRAFAENWSKFPELPAEFYTDYQFNQYPDSKLVASLHCSEYTKLNIIKNELRTYKDLVWLYNGLIDRERDEKRKNELIVCLDSIRKRFDNRA